MTREAKYFKQGVQDGKAGYITHQTFNLLADNIASWLGTTREAAIQETIRSYQRRLDCLPSLTEYPELRGMRECVEAHDNGIAVGSSMPLEAVQLRANYLHMSTQAKRIATPNDTSEPGCTVIFFPESDRGPLVGHNSDGTAAYQHETLMQWIVCNKAGLIFCTVSSGLFEEEQSPESFPVPIFLLAKETCETTADAVDMFTRLNHFWGPCNLLLADKQGDAAVIEKSACRFGLRRSENGFAATTEMSAEDASFSEYLWQTRARSLTARNLNHDSPDWAYWLAAKDRSARLQKLVSEASQAPTFEAMQRIIYDHDDTPAQIHMDGSAFHPDQVDIEWTLRTTIFVLDENRAQVSFAKPPVSSHLTPRQWIPNDEVEQVF